MNQNTSWESAESWYSSCVGEEGHYYHRSLILPSAVRLLKPITSLLDLGCGDGVLARAMSAKVDYLGLDASPSLISRAQSLSRHPFLVADVTEPLPVEKTDFDAACFLLSLQNMEHPDRAIANARKHVKRGGKILLILNHPCFRIPRQSAWGIDPANKLQYRRVNRYMTPMSIPLPVNPSRGEQSAMTISFHRSLSDIFRYLADAKCSVIALEEWCSDKKSEGAKARSEDRARAEFPLFLALLARVE